MHASEWYEVLDILRAASARMTVPIAAVKQNGSGQDVVRVIDVDNGGKVTEVPVKTGLSEGSYIEIKSGLKGTETVIVQVDKQS